MNIQLYFSDGALSNVDIQSNAIPSGSPLIPFLRNYFFLRHGVFQWLPSVTLPPRGEYRVIGTIQNAEELDTILHGSGEPSIFEQFDKKIIFSLAYHGETPPGVKMTKTLRDLPYRVVFGTLDQPKVFTARCDAISAWDAWNSLQHKLKNTIDFPAEDLLIYKVSLDRVPCHQFLMRNTPQYLSFSTKDTQSVWIFLVDNWDSIRPKLEEGAVTAASSTRSAPDNSETFRDTKSNNVTGSLVRELVVLYFPDMEVAKVDCEHIARSLSAALKYNEHPSSFHPIVTRNGIKLTDHLGQSVVPSEDMFAFKPEELIALKTPPSMRFLVLNNIPLGRDLTIREKQDWCDFHQNTN